MTNPYNQDLEQALLEAARAYYEHTNSSAFVMPLDKEKGLYVAVGSLENIRGMTEREMQWTKSKN